MSSLVYTASFVRMGRSPFGHKPKDVAVFAQHLAGGAGLTIFSNLDEPGFVLRLRHEETFSARQLMAGFAIAEPRLSLDGEAQHLSQVLRKRAASEEIAIAEDEAAVLAEAVSPLDITLIVNDCAGVVGAGGLDLTFGDWIVTKSEVEWE